jgi:hypothetical protein
VSLVEQKRLAVTLTNARSQVLDLPAEIDAADAAAVIRGERSGREINWETGDGEWLPFGNGAGWVRKRSIAEITLVDYSADEEIYIDEPYR